MKKLLLFLALLLVPLILNAASAVPYVVNKGGMSTNQTSVNPTNVGVLTLTGTGAVSIANSTAIRMVTPVVYGTNFADAVNVLSFGAVGDGVTDNSVALQAAIDFVRFASNSPTGHGATIHLPRGRYRFSQTLNLCMTNGQSGEAYAMIGDGPSATYLEYTGSTNIMELAGATYWHLGGMRISATALAQCGIVVGRYSAGNPWGLRFSCRDIRLTGGFSKAAFANVGGAEECDIRNLEINQFVDAPMFASVTTNYIGVVSSCGATFTGNDYGATANYITGGKFLNNDATNASPFVFQGNQQWTINGALIWQTANAPWVKVIIGDNGVTVGRITLSGCHLEGAVTNNTTIFYGQYYGVTPYFEIQGLQMKSCSLVGVGATPKLYDFSDGPLTNALIKDFEFTGNRFDNAIPTWFHAPNLVYRSTIQCDTYQQDDLPTASLIQSDIKAGTFYGRPYLVNSMPARALGSIPTDTNAPQGQVVWNQHRAGDPFASLGWSWSGIGWDAFYPFNPGLPTTVPTLIATNSGDLQFWASAGINDLRWKFGSGIPGYYDYNFVIASTNGIALRISPYDRQTEFYNTVTAPYFIASTGLGVGTNNPQTALHVVGTVLANNFAGDGSGLTNLPSAGSSNITDSGYVAVARNLTVNTNLIVTNNGVSTVISSNTFANGQLYPSNVFQINWTNGPALAVNRTNGQVNVPAGTAAAPGIAFNDSTTTGLYESSTGVLGISSAGNAVMHFGIGAVYFDMWPVFGVAKLSFGSSLASSDATIQRTALGTLSVNSNLNLFGTITATNGFIGPVDPGYSNVFSGTTHFTNNGVSTVIASNRISTLNVLFNTDGGGSIGQEADNRPQYLYAQNGVIADTLLQVKDGGFINFKNRTEFVSPSDGVIQLRKWAGVGFERIQFGGATGAYPSLRRTAAGLDLVGADGVGTSSNNLSVAGTLTATNGLYGPVDPNYSNVFSGTTYFSNNGVSTVIASNTITTGSILSSNATTGRWLSYDNNGAITFSNTLTGTSNLNINAAVTILAGGSGLSFSNSIMQPNAGSGYALGSTGQRFSAIYGDIVAGSIVRSLGAEAALYGSGSGDSALRLGSATVVRYMTGPQDYSPTDGTMLSRPVPGTWLFQTNVITAGTLTATNGVVHIIKPTTYADFTCSVSNQVYICNGTNQLVTLFNANANPGVLYRFTSTNGFGSFIITNATGAQTIRDGRSLSLTNIGISPVELVSDGNAWFIAARTKLVFPNAQFSCSTNIPMTSANTPYPITFDSTDWNNSQGIVRLAGTNGLHSRMWMTNAGVYEFGPSIVYNSGGPTHTARFWFMAGGANGTATNVPASCTPIKVASGDLVTTTVPFVFNVAQGPMFVEIWAQSDNTGDSFQSGSASGNFPATPSVICPVKKISDPYP